MQRYFVLTLLFLSYFSFSQDNDENGFWDNVRYGGGLGVSFGNNTTNIAVLPSAIYDFNDQFSLGVNLGYQYAKRNDISSNVYSGGILSLFNPIPEIQLSAEFEQLFVNSTFNDIKDSYNYPALYIGSAYRVNEYFTVGIRYDVLYNSNQTIYASAFSPIVRVFF
ncbi:hypothetical protein [Tenacibaculum amylolyticum]|uniref:hypothetical protein n=1 Tax=Tenacibaculum amylolyticum TaxID=104269 RepID=UPI0038958E1F